MSTVIWKVPIPVLFLVRAAACGHPSCAGVSELHLGQVYGWVVGELAVCGPEALPSVRSAGWRARRRTVWGNDSVLF